MEGREQAEEEVLTHDPSVEPSIAASQRDNAPQGLSPQAGSPVRHHPAAQGGSQPRGSIEASPTGRSAFASGKGSGRDPLVAALRQLKKDDDTDWNSRKGPEPGIRWRTGQHPQPPSFGSMTRMTFGPMQNMRRKFASGRFRCSPMLRRATKPCCSMVR